MKAKQILRMLCLENLDTKKCSIDRGLYLNCFSNFDYKFNEDIDYFSFYEGRNEQCHFLPHADLIFEDMQNDRVVYFWIID